LKFKEIEFIGSYKSLDKMPADNLPEVAFIGRSNVGKSSIINNVLNAKVAKTSSTPGKTQLINFFKINKKFYIVDLPGYGYAQVAIAIKKEWEKFIETYLRERSSLKIIVLLLDIRREPNAHDRMLSEWIKSLPTISPIIVLTKSDKVSRNDIFKNKVRIAKDLYISQHDILIHSSLSGDGRFDLIKKINSLLEPREMPAIEEGESDETNDSDEALL